MLKIVDFSKSSIMKHSCDSGYSFTFQNAKLNTNNISELDFLEKLLFFFVKLLLMKNHIYYSQCCLEKVFLHLPTI